MLTDRKENWFHHDSDDRRVQIKIIHSLRLQLYATHEICLIAPSGIIKPFARSHLEKVTTVYGPRQGDWQIDELKLLHDSVWTVFYQSTMLQYLTRVLRIRYYLRKKFVAGELFWSTMRKRRYHSPEMTAALLLKGICETQS